MSEAAELRLVNESTPACVHHWVLGDPIDGFVPGRCKRCGGERSFSAHPEGSERSDDYRELLREAGLSGVRRAV